MDKKKFIFDFKEKLLSSVEKKKEFKIVLDDNWIQAGWIRLFDLVVYRQGVPFAVFDFNEDNNTIEKDFNTIFSALKITKARFGILFNNNDFYLFDKGNRLEKFEKLSFEKIIEHLNNPSSIFLSNELKQHIANIIFKRADEFITHPQKKYFINFLDKINLGEKIQFDAKSNSFTFIDNNKGLESFENQFFNHLLGEFKETKICRYSTLKSLFTSVNNLSFRMNGLVGMNDKTEVDYVDNYLNDYSIQFQKLHYNTITAINKRYISSCSLQSMGDDLTMWRLYGDDCKGVCLFYRVNKINLNNHILLQKVSYANDDGIHPILEFLKWIKRDIEGLLGLSFEFGKLRYWKHFFKPYDYSVENEVRLLVIDSVNVPIDKRDWVLTESHSILNPVIDIKLNHPEFPLVLNEVILGPKCPEIETNKVQLEELLRCRKNQMTFEGKSYSKIDVRISDIKNYR
jgi:hypothetical protein